ncbi:MAG: hypothetical protein E7627_05525 [Ruminococcaceae bacterium]|nr:hypothetical protein [Oscillospiraceae bacterium]
MTLTEMSITGGILIGATLILRLFTKNRLPKITFVVLWCIAILRLLVPYSLESALSVYTVAEKYQVIQQEQVENYDEIEEGNDYSGDYIDNSAGEDADAWADQPVDIPAVRPSMPDNNTPVAPEGNAPVIPEGNAPVMPGDNTPVMPEGNENPVIIPDEPTTVPAEPDTKLSAEDIWGIAKVVWLAGCIICAIYFIVAYVNLRVELAASLPETNEVILRFAKKHKLIRRVEIRRSDRITTPITYGLFKPVIVMPKISYGCSEHQLEYIIEHEHVHIKRMDILVKGALIAAVCVHWFNPLVWVMLVLCNRDLELSCDEAVIRKFGKDSCKEYAYTLLGFEERRRGLNSLTSGFSKNAIEERIKSIMKLKKLSVFAIIAAVLLIAVVFVVFATSSKKDDDVPGGFETGDVETEAPETEPPVTEATGSVEEMFGFSLICPDPETLDERFVLDYTSDGEGNYCAISSKILAIFQVTELVWEDNKLRDSKTLFDASNYETMRRWFKVEDNVGITFVEQDGDIKRFEIIWGDEPTLRLIDEDRYATDFIGSDDIVPSFLTAEQKKIYRRAAEVYYSLFFNEPQWLDQYESEPSSGAVDVIEINGHQYYPSRGKYQNWSDFKALTNSVFTERLFNSRNYYDLYVEHEGRLCYRPSIKSEPYCYNYNFPEKFELISETDNEIVFKMTGFYSEMLLREGETSEERDERVASGYEFTKDYILRMVKTESGWRFDDFYSPIYDVYANYEDEESPVTEPNDKTPIPLKRYNLDSGKSWLGFYAVENWEYADYTFTENSKFRMTLCDPLYAVDEFQDILESDIAVQYDFSSKITGATINGDSYVGYAGVAEDGNIVYAFYFCDNYGSTLEVKLWQYSHIDESDYLSTTVMSIIDSFSISENYSIKIRDTVVNLEGRELRLELNDNSLAEFSALISEMVDNYDEYADVSAILVGDMKFTIVLSKQSSGTYCYAVSVSANGSEKLFPELLQLGEGYSIEFAETDLGIALGQTKNGIGNWWVYTDSGVREATDCSRDSVIRGTAKYVESELYIKDGVLYSGYKFSTEELYRFSDTIGYLEKHYDWYKDINAISLGDFWLDVRYNEHEVMPGETVMYCALESITANGQKLTVNDGWQYGGSVYLYGLFFSAGAPDKVYVYTGSSYLVTTTYIFTDTGIIELNPGNYWDESQPEFYNNSIYNFKMRDDGKLGYIRRPYKALQSVDISGQLQYVVSRDEFGKEEGYVTIEKGEVIYHPEKTYTISEIYDFDGMFEQWLEYSSTQGDVSLEGYGLLGKVKTLDEYFEQNSLRYKPATIQPATEPPVTEPPVTEPPVTEPPVTEPPVTEPPATKPVETSAPTPVPTGDYRFYSYWKAPQSYYSKTGNDYVSAVVSNNRNSVFITAEKTGTLCWYYAVSENEIPPARDFVFISSNIVTPLVNYKDFKTAFEKINNKKYEQEMEAKNTIKIDLDGYSAVVIALKDDRGNYSEMLIVENPGLDIDMGANMDTEGLEYRDDIVESISRYRSFRFKSEANGVVYARVYYTGEVGSLPKLHFDIQNYARSVYFIHKGNEAGALQYINVRRGGDYIFDLEYTIAYYTEGGEYFPAIVIDNRWFTARDLINSDKGKEYLESLYLCIQLVDGDNFYKPIVIRFDELIKAE